MRYVTARELRLRTRRLLQEAQAGEQIAVTFRGKPVALLVAFPKGDEFTVRSYEESWPEIEARLAQSPPAYKTPESALGATRRRT